MYNMIKNHLQVDFWTVNSAWRLREGVSKNLLMVYVLMGGSSTAKFVKFELWTIFKRCETLFITLKMNQKTRS